jgi:hypothetical protein
LARIGRDVPAEVSANAMPGLDEGGGTGQCRRKKADAQIWPQPPPFPALSV